MSQSEVARIREQIELEQQAAWLGLYGLAQGAAQHAFITAKMERIWELRDTLVPLVGEEEASRLMSECCERASNTLEGMGGSGDAANEQI